ncbi:MAG: helix-turn-helix domain-containing protein [Victivallaceae bacterium]|nr:helix-turn-helix domain-containing protein [Victivallaceae bacterium]
MICEKNDAFARRKARAKRLISNGRSTVSGLGAGGFPRHNFAHRAKKESLPLEVVSAGWGQWRAGCCRFREFSDTFSLEFVTDGEFVFEEENVRYAGVPGTLFFVRRGVASGMLCASENARKRTVILEGTMLDAFLENLHLAGVSFLRPAEPEKIGQLFAEIENSLRTGRSAAETASVAFRLLLEAAREIPAPASPQPPRVLREIFTAFERDPAASVPPEKWAEVLHVSVSTLHRLFLRYCGRSFGREMLRRRMEVARNYLLTTEMPIKEIAFRLGFRDRFYFSAVFKKYFGASPGIFRKSGVPVRKKL